MKPPRLRAADLTPDVNGWSTSPLHAVWNHLKRKATECLAWVLFGPDPLRTVIELGLERHSAGDLDEGFHDEAA
jgi:hypothetical protein